MNMDQIDELLKVKKKSDASKTQKAEYITEMIKLFNDVGYSETFEKYLFEGYSFAGMLPIIRILREETSDKREGLICKILSGNLFSLNEKAIGFKVSVELLAEFLIEFPDDKAIIKKIIKLIPIKAKNKSGKLTGDSPKVIEKYFVSKIKNTQNLPRLTSFELEKDEIKRLTDVLKSSVSSIKPSKSVKEEQIQNILTWLYLPESNDTKNNIINDKKTDNRNKVSAENTAAEIIKSVELKKVSSDLSEYCERLLLTAEYMSSIENKLIDLKAQIKSLENELILKNTKIDNLNNSVETNNTKINELTKKNNELEDKAKKLSDKSTDLQSVVSIYSKDKQNSLTEQLNSIASKLKVEYSDFKNAIGMDMTVELGEIMRDQLANIFKILAKAGIVVEGR